MDEEISLELRIDPARGIPIYRQIVDGIRYAISSGRLISGDRLPSVRHLASGLAVNVATIQKAYRELEVKGLVESLRGRGTYVGNVHPSVGEQERIEELWREIQIVLSTARELDIGRDELREIFDQGLEDAYLDG